MKNMISIEPMKKVTAKLEFKDLMGVPIASSSEFDFIFGVGTHGLSPFEYLLEGRSEGDEVSFKVEDRDLGQIFGHIATPCDINSFEIEPPYVVSVKVINVSSPTDREVIKALAEIANCGEHSCCT